jgi:hypothetical protein
MRKTKIVCTIGPACDSKEMMRKMIDAGMNVARINTDPGKGSKEEEDAFDGVRQRAVKMLQFSSIQRALRSESAHLRTVLLNLSRVQSSVFLKTKKRVTKQV